MDDTCRRGSVLLILLNMVESDAGGIIHRKIELHHACLLFAACSLARGTLTPQERLFSRALVLLSPFPFNSAINLMILSNFLNSRGAEIPDLRA